MLRFYNGSCLSFGGGLRLEPGELWTDGPLISYVGPPRLDMPSFEREIDLKGDVVMPGFKNAHTHTAMTFLRSYAEGRPLSQWLSEAVWPNEARLSSDAVYDFTKLGIMEYLSSGITASFDMYLKSSSNAQANVDCGFRTVLCSGLNNFDSDVTNVERDYLNFNSFHPLVSYCLGIHGEYTTSMERMEYMVSLAEKYQAPCFTHLCETRSEVESCIKRYGVTPPVLLEKIGFFRFGGGGFHCVWMNDEDIALFAEKGLWAVTNPCSNLKLASGIAPVDKMLKAGVKLAIGTDGAASNNSLNFFREMYLTSVLQKHLLDDAAAGNEEKVLEMACVGGARALGLNDCDDLAVGKKADIIVIDLTKPNMRPLNNIPANLVYAGSKENVRLTMVDGKVLYEDGEYFIGEEPQAIYERTERFMAGLRA